MPKKTNAIPVNHFDDGYHSGIVIERTIVEDLFLKPHVEADLEEAKQSHRHDLHSFFLLEKGTVSIEIDFKQYTIKPSSIIYMHPDQVHRTSGFEQIIVSSLAISNDNLNAAYMELLENIKPAKPLVLHKDTFSLLYEAVSLCIRYSERKKDKLYHAVLKDSCNALVALFISQYLEQDTSPDKLSRFEMLTKAFKEILERNYGSMKSPAVYAQQLNISAAYLNECVKNTTGNTVSYHIQQRVILEAKRLLYYSDKSVKEIATALGYDDYPYFSRLFTKVAGMTALAFRNKNHD